MLKRRGVTERSAAAMVLAAILVALPALVAAASPADGPGALVASAPVWDGVLVVDELGRVFRADSGGDDWQASSSGLPALNGRAVGIALAVSEDGVLAYLALPSGAGAIVHRSVDGGLTWSAMKEVASPVRSLTVRRVDDLAYVDVETADGARQLVDRRVELALDRPAAGPDMRLPSKMGQAVARDYDAGQIAVLTDDGTFAPASDVATHEMRVEPTVGGGYDLSFVKAGAVAPAGVDLGLADDQIRGMTLPFPFPVGGTWYTTLFVSDNGNVTFETPDSEPDAIESVERLSAGPARIAAYWDDFDPDQNGQVYADLSADRVTITWFAMAEASLGGQASFQLVLEPDGAFSIVWDAVPLPEDGLVGLSPGRGAPSFYSDLTADAPVSIPAGAAVYEQFTPDLLRLDRVMQRFFHCHADEYEQAVVFGASDFGTSLTGGALQLSETVSNYVNGIGMALFNDGDRFGSYGRLQHVVNLGALDRLPDGPDENVGGSRSVLDLLAQGFGARWSGHTSFISSDVPSAALLASDGSGWSFFHSTSGSALGGHEFRDEGDGSFTAISATDGFSELDQYLMGLRRDNEVQPFFVVTSVTDPGTCSGGPCSAGDDPQVGTVIRGTRTNVMIEDVIAAEGLRSPSSAQAPNYFRQAFIMIVPAGSSAVQEDIGQIDAYRTSWEIHSTIATAGRAAIDTFLLGQPAQPSAQVGNALRMARSGWDIVLDWSAQPVFPQRFNIHGTSDRASLADDPLAIGSTPIVATADIQRHVDPFGVTTRGDEFYYEVFWRDCADATYLP